MSYLWGAARNPGGIDRSAYPAPAGETAENRLHRLAAELAPMVDVWQRLIAQHRPTPSGHCSQCTTGGAGVPATPWPCAVYGVADLARRWRSGAP